MSAGIEGISASMETEQKFVSQLESSMSSSEEKSWSKTTKTTYTAPAGKNYRVLQMVVNFSSPLDSDNCCLHGDERIEESTEEFKEF